MFKLLLLSLLSFAALAASSSEVSDLEAALLEVGEGDYADYYSAGDMDVEGTSLVNPEKSHAFQTALVVLIIISILLNSFTFWIMSGKTYQGYWIKIVLLMNIVYEMAKIRNMEYSWQGNRLMCQAFVGADTWSVYGITFILLLLSLESIQMGYVVPDQQRMVHVLSGGSADLYLTTLRRHGRAINESMDSRLYISMLAIMVMCLFPTLILLFVFVIVNKRHETSMGYMYGYWVTRCLSLMIQSIFTFLNPCFLLWKGTEYFDRRTGFSSRLMSCFGGGWTRMIDEEEESV
ncbi:membrane protein [Cyprinid herpesvirus 2]|nr:membrane protein [Cyprinid herpesvirus 2]